MSAIAFGAAPAPRLRLTARGRTVFGTLAAIPVIAIALLVGPNVIGAEATAGSVQNSFEYVSIAPGRAGPVEISITLRTPDEHPLAAQAVTVTLENAALGIEPISAEAKLTPAGQWQAAMTAPVAGRWSLGLAVRVSDFDVVDVEAPILIK